MERGQNTGSGGGYSRFKDTGGPTGSDKVYSGTDALSKVSLDPLGVVLSELAEPIESIPEGQFFPGYVGTVQDGDPQPLELARKCLFHIGELRRAGSISWVEYDRLSDIARQAYEANIEAVASACIEFCPIAQHFGRCFIAYKNLRSQDNKRTKEVGLEAVSEVLVIRKPRTRVGREVSAAFDSSITRAFTVDPWSQPYDDERRMANFRLTDHFEDWEETFGLPVSLPVGSSPEFSQPKLLEVAERT